MGRDRLMPIYEFKCEDCGLDFQSFRSVGDTAPPNCPTCRAVTKRKFSRFGMPVTFNEGWNQQLGSYVTSYRDHSEQLKRKSEADTLHTGIPCQYEPVHPADQREVFGITDEGLDATYRRQTDTGQRQKQIWV